MNGCSRSARKGKLTANGEVFHRAESLIGGRKLSQCGPSRRRTLTNRCSPVVATPLKILAETRQATCTYGAPLVLLATSVQRFARFLCRSGGHFLLQASRFEESAVATGRLLFIVDPRSEVHRTSKERPKRVSNCCILSRETWRSYGATCSCIDRDDEQKMSQMSCVEDGVLENP